MGLSSLLNKASGAAAPPPMLVGVGRPLGVVPTFCAHQQQMALKVREHKLSFSGDDFSIKDAVTNQKVFEVDGKAMSLHSKKIIKDAHGRPIFTLTKKLIAIHATYDGVDASGKELFTIKKKFGIGANLRITFRNVAGAGEEVELHVKGDWFDRRASIALPDGTPVAHISRSFMNVGQLLADTQTYFLTVAPGVDAALVAAAAVCLDEAENDQKHN